MQCVSRKLHSHQAGTQDLFKGNTMQRRSRATHAQAPSSLARSIQPTASQLRAMPPTHWHWLPACHLPAWSRMRPSNPQSSIQPARPQLGAMPPVWPGPQLRAVCTHAPARIRPAAATHPAHGPPARSRVPHPAATPSRVPRPPARRGAAHPAQHVPFFFSGEGPNLTAWGN